MPNSDLLPSLLFKINENQLALCADDFLTFDVCFSQMASYAAMHYVPPTLIG